MSAELTALALAGLLQVLQFALMAIPTNLEAGTAKTLSPRDPDRLGGNLATQVGRRTGRLIRAYDNHFEALILFAVAVTVVTLGEASDSLTAVCAWTYLGARVLYVPAYALGWVPWRSAIWMVGLLATALMLIAALV